MARYEPIHRSERIEQAHVIKRRWSVENHEYKQIQDMVVSIAYVAAGLDLEGFLARLDRADSIGPIVDPSLWMAANENMQRIRKVASAALKLKKALLEVLEDGEI